MLASPKAISPVSGRDDQFENPSSPYSRSPKEDELTIRAQSITYPRSFLLSIALPLVSSSMPNQDHIQLKPEVKRRLSSFTPILRESISPPSESNSMVTLGSLADELYLFDNQPISKDLPIPKFPGEVRHPCDRSSISKSNSVSRGNSCDSYTTNSNTELNTFNSTSFDGNKLPILVDFNNPFSDSHDRPSSPENLLDNNQEENKGINIANGVPIPHNGGRRSSSNMNHPLMNLPKSVNSSTTSLTSLNLGSIRLGPREDLVGSSLHRGGLSRSNSNSSISSFRSNSNPVPRSTSFSKDKNELNPFAPPFPLPASNSNNNSGGPQLIHPNPLNYNDSKAISINGSTPNSQSNSPELSSSGGGEEASLPLPKVGLPSSLPQKPSPLPPVFVKRESAALPQPMALPDIPVLGKDWMGENSISGNEKRRRASQVGLFNGISRSNSPLGGGRLSGSAPSSRRGSFSSDFDNQTLKPVNALGGSISRSNSPSLGNGSTNANSRPDRLIKLGQRLRSESQPGKQRW